MPSAPAVSGDAAGTYGPAFFDKQARASHRSAAVILPVVFGLVDCASVVDVGCGVGSWLRAAAELGVEDCLGIDGHWVPVDRLAIPADRFRTHDLREPLDLGRSFDLAICVEVAEHLPPAAAATLVTTLTRLAPVVLFSAAVPDQGGDGHINEQWPGYWAELFATRGYAAHDRVRLPVWHDDRADWWYRQNVLLYVDRTRRPNALGEPVAVPPALIHPEMIHAVLTRPPPPAAPPPAEPHPALPREELRKPLAESVQVAGPAGGADIRPASARPNLRGRAVGSVRRRLDPARAAARSARRRVRRLVRRAGGAGR